MSELIPTSTSGQVAWCIRQIRRLGRASGGGGGGSGADFTTVLAVSLTDLGWRTSSGGGDITAIMAWDSTTAVDEAAGGALPSWYHGVVSGTVGYIQLDPGIYSVTYRFTLAVSAALGMLGRMVLNGSSTSSTHNGDKVVADLGLTQPFETVRTVYGTASSGEADVYVPQFRFYDHTDHSGLIGGDAIYFGTGTASIVKLA